MTGNMIPKNVNAIKLDVHLTDKILAKELISRSEFASRLSCHKIYIPPNEKYPVHEHPSEHIILILDGGGWMKYWDNKKEHSFDLRNGDVFFVPANVPHQVGAYELGANMLAISSDSKPLTDPQRMRIVKQ
ncbi:MAG TPA: cupin domain-containing protein [archaeon]|nr:cupin domain-containing protein [archaeon]